MKKNDKKKFIKSYDQEMLRSAFSSMIWHIFQYKKDHENLKQKDIADRLGINKSAPSRWFSGQRPNWSLNTISDIAGALDVDVKFRAIDRKTGVAFTPVGIESRWNNGLETETESLPPVPQKTFSEQGASKKSKGRIVEISSTNSKKGNLPQFTSVS